MKATNKLLATILTLTIVVGLLASCDIVTPPVNDARDPGTYTARVSVRFATNDDKMKDAIDALSSDATVLKDGDNLSVTTLSETEDASIHESYILSGGMLFHSLLVKVGEYSLNEYKMAFVSDGEIESIAARIGQGASVGAEDFKTFENVGSEIVYSDILEESKASLVLIMSDKLATIGAEVDITDASLSVTNDGDFIISSVLSCNYEISLNGEVYSVIMRLYTDYDYTSEVMISIPDDADKYQPASLDEIIK